MSAPKSVPGLVPPTDRLSRGRQQLPAAEIVPAVRRPPVRRLPLPQLPPPLSPGRTVYGLSTVTRFGRLNERRIPRRLGWVAGTRLDVQVDQGLIVLAADPRGLFTISAQGFVLLPAAARRWCGLGATDRVFLVADPEDGWMVLHPPAAVDTMVAAAHRAIWGGEAG
ncbi:hypothetical protein [Cryptosporangium sp. NPDC048952]|uniref:hypothetical protein n=1 Tax=Cryptosporangium sp. NPDC048952 TaxID=3363961 RepID=UPI0037238AF2